MNDSFSKEVAIRALLKTKGYEFDHHHHWWVREWSTNNGQEKVLEVAAKGDNGEWQKMMMKPDGYLFYTETIREEIEE